jgi:hypothetical protein
MIRAYFRTLGRVLFQPREFFHALRESGYQVPSDRRLAWALAFALVTDWAASFINFILRNTLIRTFGERFLSPLESGDQLFRGFLESQGRGKSGVYSEVRDQVIEWFWGASSLAILPLVTLWKILFTSFLIFVASRILISPKPHLAQGEVGPPPQIRFETAVLLVSYSMAGSVFGIFPWVGSGIATLLTLFLSYLGARSLYGTDRLRAVLLVLFPTLLMVGVMIAAGALIILGLMRLFATLLA